MQKFSDWRVGSRLGAAFATLILFTVVIGGVGMSSMSTIDDALENVVQRLYPLSYKANETLKRLTVQVTYHQQLLLRSDPATVARVNQLIVENREVIGGLLAELDKGLMDVSARASLKKYMQLRADYQASSRRILDAITAEHRTQAVQEYLETMDPLQQEMKEKLTDLANREHELMLESDVRADAAYSSARLIMALLIVAATILGACVALFMTRGVTRPLTQAVALAQRVVLVREC